MTSAITVFALGIGSVSALTLSQSASVERHYHVAKHETPHGGFYSEGMEQSSTDTRQEVRTDDEGNQDDLATPKEEHFPEWGWE